MMVMAILSVAIMLTPPSDTLARTPGVSLLHYTNPVGYCYWNGSQSFNTSFTFSGDAETINYGVNYPSHLQVSQWSGCNDKAFRSGTINLTQDNEGQTLLCTINIISDSVSNASNTCLGFDFSRGNTVGVWIDVEYVENYSYTTFIETFTVV